MHKFCFLCLGKIPGVRYVPMVGKVTVAMLERNLLRLHENFGEGIVVCCVAFLDGRALKFPLCWF